MNCPRCQSSNFKLNGKTPKGTTRYRCKECNKTWSNGILGRPPIGLVAMTNAERKKKFRSQNK